MILGDPIIFGSSGGPSSSDAILTVTVMTGSTVTMTKGGITLTPTMWVQAADNTLDCALFVISPSLFDAQNAWTVTATNELSSSSATVTISTNNLYDITLDIWAGEIYMHGEQYQQQTGGFEVVRVMSSSHSSAPIAQVSYGSVPNGVISLSVSGGFANGAVCTVNPIDLTRFNTMTVKLQSNSFGANRLYIMANSTKSGITLDNNADRNCDFFSIVGASATGDVTLDVSSANGSFYLLSGGFTVEPKYSCTISEWYLS